MAVSAQEQKQLVQLVIGMLGIAPGHAYLPLVEKVFEDLGRNWTDMANAIAGLPQFQALYPPGMAAGDFATRFLGSVGLQNDAGVHALVAQLFKDGVPPGQIILMGVQALGSTTAPQYAAARALLENKTAVALYHAQVLGRTDTDFAVLAKVLANVTSDPASVGAAQLALNPSAPPAPPDPVFTVTKDGSNAVSFSTYGTQIDVALAGGTYTFTTSGGVAGTATLAGSIASMALPASVALHIESAVAAGIVFSGAGTVRLTDTGPLPAATLVALDAATAGLLDASGVGAITGATVAEATLLLVTNNGASGNKIKTAANVQVTLTGASAAAADLKAIEAATTGWVDASSVTAITSAVAADAVLLLVTRNGATGDAIGTAANAVVALTDTVAAAADLNAIDGATTGLVSAVSLTGITGTTADVKTTLEAITVGTALSAGNLHAVTLSDAIAASTLDSVVFANDATITLANVGGNALTLANGTTGPGRVLTIDGSGVASAIGINAQAETDGRIAIFGGDGQDNITGSSGNDTLNGGNGNDSITGGTGSDSIQGGEGDDTIYMGSALTSADTVDGGNGTDTLVLATVSGSAAFNNVRHIETVRVTNATTISLSTSVTPSFTFDFSASTSQALALGAGYTNATSVDLTGDGGGHDSIDNSTADVDLTIRGRVVDFNASTIVGGSGIDRLVMTADADSADLSGATDIDQVTILASGTNPTQGAILTGLSSVVGVTVTVDASALTNSAAALQFTAGINTGHFSVTGGAGNDTIVGGDTVNGGGGNDSITGGARADSLNGGDGNDFLSGGGNIDTLEGGAGDDTLDGGASSDTILLGGGGNDQWRIADGDGTDTVSGFTAGTGVDKDTVDWTGTLVSGDGTTVPSGNAITSANFLVLDAVASAGGVITIANAAGYTSQSVVLVVDSSVATLSSNTVTSFRAIFGAAGTNVITAAANDLSRLLVVAYDGNTASANASLFLVDLANSADGTGQIALTDTVMLLGILTGVGADALVAANFM